jgi:putative redox protein
MGSVQVVWKGEGQFLGRDARGQTAAISTQEAAPGMKPTDLLLTALAGCTAVEVVSILAKMRQPLSALTIEVEGWQDPDPPWAFRRIHLRFSGRGLRLEPAAVRRAIELAEGKYCSVAATLRPTVELTTSFVIEGQGGQAEGGMV